MKEPLKELKQGIYGTQSESSMSEVIAAVNTLIRERNERETRLYPFWTVPVEDLKPYGGDFVYDNLIPQPQEEHDMDYCGKDGCICFRTDGSPYHEGGICKCHKKKECTSHGPYEGDQCPVGMGGFGVSTTIIPGIMEQLDKDWFEGTSPKKEAKVMCVLDASFDQANKEVAGKRIESLSHIARDAREEIIDDLIAIDFSLGDDTDMDSRLLSNVIEKVRQLKICTHE